MVRDRADIRAIKERIDPVAVISRYVSLRKAGASYKGKCPFHKDDTPSFVVNPEKGLWHCFGCGEGGDIVSFMMKIERISFVEAAQRLAAEVGLEFRSGEAGGGDRDRLRDAMAAAAEHFAQNLRGPAGAKARAYLTKRGYGKEAWDRFSLGYALPGWDGLKKALLSRFDKGTLVELGLLVERDEKLYDRFRDRTMFTVFDLSGRPIAFGGRAFEGEPKYLNSPATPLFDKSRTLYGLSWARDGFAHDRTAVLVEGYTDTLSLHCAGVTQVVASMGTALTQGQADLLARFVDDVIIVYDRDAAGSAAALRGMQILGNSGLTVRVARLDEGEDPDSVVRAGGAEALREALDRAVPFYRFYVEELRGRFDPTSVGGKERILNETREFARGIRSLPLRHAFAAELGGLLDLSDDGVMRELWRTKRLRPATEAVLPRTDARSPEEDLLVLLLRGEIGWSRVAGSLSADDFSAENRAIAKALADAEDTPDVSELVRRLDDETGKRASMYALAGVRFDDVERAADDAVRKLVRIPSIEREIADLDAEIAACEESGDRERLDELTLKKVDLIKEKLARRETHGQER
jgi:DNA primase